jgi:hypothetical protein
MWAADARSWLKLFKEAATGENPYMDPDHTDINPAEEQVKYQVLLDELIADGYGPLNVFERFKRAGMGKEYRIVYAYLSSHGHNNLSYMINRHFNISEATETIVAMLHQTTHDDNQGIYYTTQAGMLLVAGGMIHKRQETGLEELFEQIDTNGIEVIYQAATDEAEL